jgi:S1-C subfamily serine protease
MTSVIRSVPDSVMEFNEGERSLRPQGEGPHHEVHGSRSVAGGGDVGTERTEHEQGTPSRYPGDIPRSEWGVVSIVMSDKDGHPVAQGSGFLISKDGQVVTNYHVIKNGSSAVIKLPDGAFFVVDGVLASDKDRDVAIIKAHGNDFRAVNSRRFRSAPSWRGSCRHRQSAFARIDGFKRHCQRDPNCRGRRGQVLADHGADFPGSSGGPLFNMAGKVVGITTSHIKGGENLNFAIPINDVKLMLRATLSTVSALPDEPEDKPTSTNQGPDFKATVSFMRKMVEPDGRFIGYDVKQDNGVKFDFVGDATASCDINFSGQFRRTAAMLDGFKKDQYGNLEPTYSVLQECSYRRVSLGAIDPSTITSVSAPSLEYLGKMRDAHGEVLASDLKHSDQTIVTFKDSDGSVKNFGILIFLSEDRAERFITAMRHAVTLCGGKESPFARTATQ